jgi:hypothetical protein
MNSRFLVLSCVLSFCLTLILYFWLARRRKQEAGIAPPNQSLARLFTYVSIPLVATFYAAFFLSGGLSYITSTKSDPQVVVHQPTTTLHEEPTFAELVRPTEEPGYGLYSYLLFGREPQDAYEKARDISAIKSITGFPGPTQLQRAGFTKESLNITYLPLKSAVAINTRPMDDKTATALLQAYNFARARFLLDRINPKFKRGPYIISVLTPLTMQAPDRYLFMDLGSATPQLVGQWVGLFAVESGRENFSEPMAGDRFLLTMRNDIDIIAHDVMPNMPSKLADLIGWQRLEASGSKP